MFLPLGISVFVIMLASLSGGFFAWKLMGNWIAPRLRYLVALAAGVFLVVIFSLLSEVLEQGFSYSVIVAFVLGGILLELLTIIMPKGTHHHHGPHPEHTHSQIDARRMLMGDAIHNVHDGLTLVPAFLVSPIVGFGTAVGVLLHEIVQEIAEFFVLREAGYSVRKTLLWNFIVSSTILIGVVLASVLVSIEDFARPLMAFSAGGFSYVVLRDLIPSILRHAKQESCYLRYAVAFLVGLILMISVSLLVPHKEKGEEEFLIPEGFGLAMNSTPHTPF